MTEVDSSAELALKNMTQGIPLCSETALFSIDSQGHWRYLDSPLPSKFARLFYSILHYVDEEYYLITPVEKVKVQVAKVPLYIVDYLQDDTGTMTVISAISTQHENIKVSDFIVGEQAISLTLENGLKAELGRACYYRFIEEFVFNENS